MEGGETCEADGICLGCPPGYYGQRCSFHCASSLDEYCQGLLICLPDPYGCSCYSGWFGTFCNQSNLLTALFETPSIDRTNENLLKVAHRIVTVPTVSINVPARRVIVLRACAIVMEPNATKELIVDHI